MEEETDFLDRYENFDDDDDNISGDAMDLGQKTREINFMEHSESKFRKNPIFAGQKCIFLHFQKYKNTFFAISKMEKNPFLHKKNV